ncbi:response regulator transcription factor [Novosphingobium sp. MMS21-SN21R]|uniref:response regulator transcription factor n=1 Tax=Novosphingobium sp. MMS21-SN21R TaxID=2969298 RepID=UPI0028879342|nr:response regulator transcription factor [Novosphingobium sp. MMS21-SN21R]MDT0506937.1 response regulator transcription factor [Novosphingobium sp. MMS21-SN21R]
MPKNSNLVSRVAVVDDHPLCRMSLKAMIQAVDPSIIVVEFDNISALVACDDKDQFKVIFLDLALPDGQGLMNVSIIRSVARHAPVVVVTADEKPETRSGALQLGAAGFWPKSGKISEMEEILRDVLQHREVEPAPRAGKAADSALQEGEAVVTAESANLLSRAQLKVFSQLAKGHSNKVIAFDLGISEATVKSHLAAIYRALGATNRSQSLIKAKELGLIA